MSVSVRTHLCTIILCPLSMAAVTKIQLSGYFTSDISEILHKYKTLMSFFFQELCKVMSCQVMVKTFDDL